MNGTVTTTRGQADATDANERIEERNKRIMFKNCALLTECISEIINTRVSNVNHLDVLMVMYSLMEYSNNYSKTFGSL